MLKPPNAPIKRILSSPSRRALRDVWENLWDWIEAIAFGLRFMLTRRPRPRLLLYFGFAPGDDLLCTAVMRELHKRGRDGLMMVSGHRELFEGNQDASYVQPLWARYSRDRSTVSICRRFVQIWGGEFTRLEYAPMDGTDRRKSPSRHIIAEMCSRAGISGSVLVKPYLALSDDERSAASWARNRVVIQSSGMAARHPMQNKQWYEGRFQRVVDAFVGEIDFVQIGSADDPPLQRITDLRGATKIRETAAILYHARLYVGTVGFPMHLARAVECPSVIIFGGREAPWQSGYVCNFNIYSEVPCAPCWRSNTCDFDRRCMRDISVEDVVLAIRHMMARPRNPLVVERIEITPENQTTTSTFPHSRREST